MDDCFDGRGHYEPMNHFWFPKEPFSDYFHSVKNQNKVCPLLRTFYAMESSIEVQVSSRRTIIFHWFYSINNLKNLFPLLRTFYAMERSIDVQSSSRSHQSQHSKFPDRGDAKSHFWFLKEPFKQQFLEDILII